MIITLCLQTTECCITLKCCRLKSLDLPHLQSCGDAREKWWKLPIGLSTSHCVCLLRARCWHRGGWRFHFKAALTLPYVWVWRERMNERGRVKMMQQWSYKIDNKDIVRIQLRFAPAYQQRLSCKPQRARLQMLLQVIFGRS